MVKRIGRIGHIYIIKRRIGHIWIREVIRNASKSEVEDKV